MLGEHLRKMIVAPGPQAAHVWKPHDDEMRPRFPIVIKLGGVCCNDMQAVKTSVCQVKESSGIRAIGVCDDGCEGGLLALQCSR